MKSLFNFVLLHAVGMFILISNIKICLSEDCRVAQVQVINAWQSSTFQGSVLQQLVAKLLGYSAFSANNTVARTGPSPGGILGTCSQTKQEMDPWLQVQLAGTYYVTTVIISTPSACNSCNIDTTVEQVLLEVGEVSVDFTNKAWYQQWNANKKNCTFIKQQLQPDSTYDINCSIPLRGNFVRLTKSLGRLTTLSVCKLDVKGFPFCSSSVTPSSSFIPSSVSSASTSILTTISTDFFQTTTLTTSFLLSQSVKETPIFASKQISFWYGSEATSHLIMETSPLLPEQTYNTRSTSYSSEAEAVPMFTSSFSTKSSTETSKSQFSSEQLFSLQGTLSETTALTIQVSSVFTWEIFDTSVYQYSSLSFRRESSQIISSAEISATTSISSAPELVTWMSSRYASFNMVSEFTQPYSKEVFTVLGHSSSAVVSCPCTCEQAELLANLTTTNKTSDEIKEEIEEILVNMTIIAKTTTRNERKLVSADDGRRSSTVIGTVGVAFVVMVFGLIVASDFPGIVMFVKSIFHTRQG